MRGLSLLLAALASAAPTLAQDVPRVDLVIVPRAVVAVREHEGDYAGLAGAFGEVIAYLTEHGIAAAGPGFSLVGEDPRDVPESRLRSAAIVPVGIAEKDVRLYPAGAVSLRVLPARLVLATAHHGPHSGVRTAFERLHRGLGNRGVKFKGLSEHVYLSAPEIPALAQESFARIQVEPTGPTDVGIYADRGTFGPSLIALSRALSAEKITVRPITAEEILDGKLSKRCEMLLVPGGWAADYKAALGEKGAKLLEIFVGRGGGYLGICAGAFFAAEKILWEGVEIPYPLDLFPGIPKGPIAEIAPWPEFVVTRIRFTGKHPITKDLGEDRTVLYYGGPSLAPQRGARVKVLATYGDSELPALVAFTAGRGRVLLSGVHPEIRLGVDQETIGWPEGAVENADPDSDLVLLVRAVRWILGELR